MGELTSWRQRLRCRGDCQSLLPPASTPSVPTLCGSKLLSFHLAVCLPIPCPECCAAAAAWVPAVAGQSLAGSLLQSAVLIIATTFALFSFFSSSTREGGRGRLCLSNSLMLLLLYAHGLNSH